MNVAVWLLTALLALPVAEFVVFVLVAVWIGFLWAVLALLTTTLAGALILRHGGGIHIARIRTVLGPQRVTALEADGPGTMTLLAGVLLLIPGFITDVIGVLLLVPPLRRSLGVLVLRAFTGPATKREGVVDLAPQEWRKMPEAKLRDERDRQSGPRATP